MKIIQTLKELREWRESLKYSDTLGFVPTMGALHKGHLSLMEKSQAQCKKTAVSIFINPLQFGPEEDLSKYPRMIEKDCELLEKQGIDILFNPDTQTMYPPDRSTSVIEESLSLPLCGAFRSGHFRGVATVVLKLLNLVQPHFLYLGNKDYQQVRVIEKMIVDLNFPCSVIACPTLREADGMAISSRNQYLLPQERERAATLYKSLKAIKSAYERGEKNTQALKKIGQELLTDFKIQYLEICHRKTLQPLKAVTHEGALVAIAAHLGTTRLIDNLELT